MTFAALERKAAQLMAERERAWEAELRKQGRAVAYRLHDEAEWVKCTSPRDKGRGLEHVRR